jgi:hypothetical protein
MFVLMIIIKILLYILIFVVGLILLLLLIHVNYYSQVLTADGLKIKLALGWAWKLIGINAEVEGEVYDITLRILDRKVYKMKRKETVEEEDQPEKKPENKEKGKKGRRELSIKDFSDRTLIDEALEYIKKVLNIAKPKYLHLYGTYGFDDPSLTGIVCGTVGILKSMIPHGRLGLSPDFSQETIDLDFCVEGSMMVGSLAYQTLRTVLKKPVRKIIFKKKKN